MFCAIVLGNRLNDDTTISEKMKKRLELALYIEKVLSPDKIIVAGGIANPVAGVSEASVMKKYLVDAGVAPEKIVEEGKSKTTYQNAKFAVPMAVKMGATKILMCTSPEHMHRDKFNPKKYFGARMKRHKDIPFFTCCTVEEIDNLASILN